MRKTHNVRVEAGEGLARPLPSVWVDTQLTTKTKSRRPRGKSLPASLINSRKDIKENDNCERIAKYYAHKYHKCRIICLNLRRLLHWLLGMKLTAWKGPVKPTRPISPSHPRVLVSFYQTQGLSKKLYISTRNCILQIRKVFLSFCYFFRIYHLLILCFPKKT